MDKREVLDKINTSNDWLVGALIKLYDYQTAEEQSHNTTIFDNSLGFNAFDADAMTSISQQFLKNGTLTDRQIAFVRMTLRKYANQLATHGFAPLTVKKPEEHAKKPIVGYKKAEFLDNNQKWIKCIFQFPKGDLNFSKTLDFIKSLSNRKWIGKDRYWKVGACLENGEKLLENGFEFSKDLKRWLNSFKGGRATEIKPVEVPGLNGELMPFQKQGIAFINSRNGRALIGDEMGLGKTIQAIGYLQLHPEKRPALVVCPASLKINWKNEINKWMTCGDKIQIASGKKPKKIFGNILIINYDILAGWQNALIQHGFKTSIWDEVHYLKNSKSQRTEVGKKIAKHIKSVIALSGTPIVNRTSEFFNPINMIRSDLFPSYWNFMHEYTNASNNGFGWKFEGGRNSEKLHKILTETIMIRRLKKEVLPQLPDKVRSVIPMEINNRKEYDSAHNDIISWLCKNDSVNSAKKAKNAEVLVKFEKLKQLTVEGKIQKVIDWVEIFLQSDEKLVLFATHTKTLVILQEHFRSICVRLDGKTKTENRQKIVDDFQNCDDIKLFLGNIKAAGVGGTLTAASNVGFVELPWTPGDFEQAADRCHRIGQKNCVNIYALIAEDTIEEDIANILSNKQKTLDGVLDGKITEEDSLLSELINRLKEK